MTCCSLGISVYIQALSRFNAQQGCVLVWSNIVAILIAILEFLAIKAYDTVASWVWKLFIDNYPLLSTVMWQRLHDY